MRDGPTRVPSAPKCSGVKGFEGSGSKACLGFRVECAFRPELPTKNDLVDRACCLFGQRYVLYPCILALASRQKSHEKVYMKGCAAVERFGQLETIRQLSSNLEQIRQS